MVTLNLGSKVANKVYGPVLTRLDIAENQLAGLISYVELMDLSSITDKLDTIESSVDDIDLDPISSFDYTLDDIQSTVNDIQSTVDDFDIPDFGDWDEKVTDINDRVESIYYQMDTVEAYGSELSEKVTELDTKLDALAERMDKIVSAFNDTMWAVERIEEFLLKQGGITVDVNVRRTAEVQ